MVHCNEPFSSAGKHAMFSCQFIKSTQQKLMQFNSPAVYPPFVKVTMIIIINLFQRTQGCFTHMDADKTNTHEQKITVTMPGITDLTVNRRESQRTGASTLMTLFPKDHRVV